MANFFEVAARSARKLANNLGKNNSVLSSVFQQLFRRIERGVDAYMMGAISGDSRRVHGKGNPPHVRGEESKGHEECTEGGSAPKMQRTGTRDDAVVA